MEPQSQYAAMLFTSGIKPRFLIWINVDGVGFLPNLLVMLISKNLIALLSTIHTSLYAILWLAPLRLLDPLLATLTVKRANLFTCPLVAIRLPVQRDR